MRIAYFSALLFVSVIGFAQAPQRFSFQAVVRHPDTSLVTYKQISVRLSILKGDINGAVVYSETHSPRTNGLGLFTLEVGGGTVQSGDFSSIDWGNDSYFIKREIDPTGGTNYTISGTSQMLSVPYALHAESARRLKYPFESSFPDGIFGNPISLNLSATETYTVPTGFNLFISSRSHGNYGNCGDREWLINETFRFTDYAGAIGAGNTIKYINPSGNCPIQRYYGFLVPNNSRNYVEFFFSNGDSYTVPEGKILVLINHPQICFDSGEIILSSTDDLFIFFSGHKIVYCGDNPFYTLGYLLDN